MTSRANVNISSTCVIPGGNEPPDLPWYPAWTSRAACRGMWSRTGPEPFFDYGTDRDRITAAKRVCWTCPVREQCLRENLSVPYGVFGGYTEKERRRLRGDHRGRSRELGYFSQFMPYGSGRPNGQ